ncbi:MAG: serine/threonine-protein kinase [Planctomycetota bacterium]
MNDLDALVEDLVCQCLQAREHGDSAAIERLFAAQPAEVRAQVTAMLGTLDRVGLTGDAVPAPTDAHAIPFGPYLLLERLGAGAMGVVYRARDPGGVERALKLLQPGLVPVRQARLRFEREIQALRELDHPGICPILDAGEVDGVPFLVMPLLSGETLQAVFARGPARDHASRQRLLRIVEQVAQALHHAHERGFVHRDVKPANILLTTDDRPVVLDFGLARLDRDGAAALSQSHEVIGAPAYMAPEQIVDGARVDRRADVYALGVVLYEGLTGRCPYEAATRESLYRRVLTGDATSPSRRVPDVPAAFDTVCLTALAREPDRRYQTATDLAADLGRVGAGERPLAQLPGPLERTRRWIQKNPLPSTLMALLVVAVVAALWQAVEQHRSSTRDRARLLAAEAFDVLPADPGRAEQLAGEAHALAPDVLDSLTAIEAARAAEREDLVLSGHTRPVTDLEFSGDGKHLVSASLDGTARIWDLRTAAGIALPHDGDGPALARFQPGDQLIATAGRSDGCIRAWDVTSRTLRWQAAPHPLGTAVRVLSWSPTGDWLVTAGPGIALLWSASGEAREVVRTNGGVTAGAWIAPTEFVLGSEGLDAAADTGHWVRTFRVDDAGTPHPQDDHSLTSGVVSLHTRPEAPAAAGPATMLVVCARQTYRWTVGSTPEGLPTIQERGVHAAGWAADGERVVTLGAGGAMAILAPGEKPRIVQTVSWATGLVPHPRQNYVFVSAGAGVVQIRSLDGAGARLLGR